MIAVMENYQHPDGTIEVPEVLRPFMGGAASIGLFDTSGIDIRHVEE
jgi:seryl-tRNA synthetase